MAVASGSGLGRLEHSLKLTRLWDFLAGKLGVSPSRCLVIEDSQHGTHAGKAAGMTVYGFTGAGADAVFSDMPSLQAALGL